MYVGQIEIETGLQETAGNSSDGSKNEMDEIGNR